MENDEVERLLILRNRKFQEAEIDERLEKLLGNADAVLKLEVYFLYICNCSYSAFLK